MSGPDIQKLDHGHKVSLLFYDLCLWIVYVGMHLFFIHGSVWIKSDVLGLGLESVPLMVLSDSVDFLAILMIVLRRR